MSRLVLTYLKNYAFPTPQKNEITCRSLFNFPTYLFDVRRDVGLTGDLSMHGWRSFGGVGGKSLQISVLAFRGAALVDFGLDPFLALEEKLAWGDVTAV